MCPDHLLGAPSFIHYRPLVALFGRDCLTAVLMRKGFTILPFVPYPEPPGFPHSRLGTGAGDPPLDKKNKTSERRIGFCLGKLDPHPVRKLSGVAAPRLLLRFCSLLLSLSSRLLAFSFIVVIIKWHLVRALQLDLCIKKWHPTKWEVV